MDDVDDVLFADFPPEPTPAAARRRVVAAEGPRQLAMLWSIGGGVCDLPPQYLDELAVMVRSDHRKPLAVVKAQRQFDDLGGAA